MFSKDLTDLFTNLAGSFDKEKNEIFLFRSLIQSICLAASKNGYSTEVIESHRSYVNFVEDGDKYFYNKKDIGKCVCCELADIMIIAYDENEARLCFMQNKYDRRPSRGADFKLDTRQLYILKNRLEYWKGRRHSENESPVQLLSEAQYSSITNYGVFSYDLSRKCYDMEYYNADAILAPRARGRSIVAKFDSIYPQYNTIEHTDDQMNYACTIEEFGKGLENFQIGQKYGSLNELLEKVNLEPVIAQSPNSEVTKVEYNNKRTSISARCIVTINFGKQDKELKGFSNEM